MGIGFRHHFLARVSFVLITLNCTTLFGFGQKPTPTPAPDPIESPSPAGVTIEKISDLVSRSSCAKLSWANRGRAPAGYSKGMALSFARTLCRLEGLDQLKSSAELIARSQSGDANRDALSHYATTYRSQDIEIDREGVDALRAIYTLGFGLGMRESSGKYCTGWDTSAGSGRPSNTAEAGIFQTSLDSIGFSPELKKLYAEYREHPERCLLNTFKEGVSSCSQSILGTGEGAVYQKIFRSCPALSAEYAMTLLRIQRRHFGPINRKEAQISPDCYDLLGDVQNLVLQAPRSACRDLN